MVGAFWRSREQRGGWWLASVLSVHALLAHDTSAQSRTAATTSAPLVSINGRVVTADTDEAIPNARIAVTSDERRDPIVLVTNGDGEFRTQTAGRAITVSVTKTGFGPALLRAAGNVPLAVRLSRNAVISGRVVDQFGAPMVNQSVEAERVEGASVSRTAASLTDDRGEFRLSGLTAGRYRVSTLLPGGVFARVVDGRVEMPSRARVFYPGATEPSSAEALDLESGEERTDVTLVLPTTASERALAADGVLMAGGSSFGEPVNGPDAAAVRGRIVDRAGRPVSDATVQMRGSRFARIAASGLDGEYSFAGLPPASFDIVASKPGHTQFGIVGGSPSRPFASVNLRPGDTVTAPELVIAPWSTMTGRVVDEYGDPVQGARVQLMRVRHERGRERLVGAGAAVRATNDLGEYRLWGITPGRYLVSATVGEVLSAELPGYGRSYFPGTADPNASSYVTVDASHDVTGVDITLVPQPTYHISGRLLDSSGRPTNGGSLTLLPSVHSSSPLGIHTGARIERDGSFEFANVTPGAYVIQSSGGQSSGPGANEAGVLSVSVGDGDVRDLVLRRSRGSSISGRVVADAGAADTATFTGIDITTVPADADYELSNGRIQARVDRDQRFLLQVLDGPRRLVIRGLRPGWALARITMGSSDVTDRAIDFGRENIAADDVEVVLTNRVSVLQGTMTDRNGRTIARESLVVFSADREHWYPGSRFVRRAATSAEGTYRLEGLPIGTYHVAPITRLPEGDEPWTDPLYLETLMSQAMTASVTDGSTTIVNVRTDR